MRHRESLATVPIFEGLAVTEIARLDSQCTWRRYDEGERILSFRDPGDDVYFVVWGRVRVTARLKDHKETIFSDLSDGAVFGELSAVDGLPRSADVEAMTACTIAKMSAAVFKSAIHRHPKVCDRVLHLLAQRLRATGARVVEFQSLNVQHRIFSELLRLARAHSGDPNVAAISPPPYHHEIAARIGTRREAVAREMKALERGGITERRKGALVIRDVQALEQLVALNQIST